MKISPFAGRLGRSVVTGLPAALPSRRGVVDAPVALPRFGQWLAPASLFERTPLPFVVQWRHLASMPLQLGTASRQRLPTCHGCKLHLWFF